MSDSNSSKSLVRRAAGELVHATSSAGGIRARMTAGALELATRRAGSFPGQSYGIDPEVMMAVVKLGAYSVAEGAVNFTQWVRDILKTTRQVNIPDNQVTPFLKEVYGAISSNPEKYGIDDATADAMDATRDVRKIDVDAIAREFVTNQGKSNEPNKRGSTNLERDSTKPATQDGMGENGILNDGRGNDRTRGQGVLIDEENARGERGERVPGLKAVATGAQGDSSPYAAEPRIETSIAGIELNRGSSDVNFDGQTIEPAGTSQTDAVTQGGLSLAEKRFAKPDGYGLLFTNETGTGKKASER